MNATQPLPRISIVTPCFNHVDFIGAAIESVLSQEYPDLEYIVIDGGSTDGSVDVIRQYGDRLTYWCSEPDDGFYHAINKGFSLSTGEIMGWLNSDDLHCPWVLKTVGQAMRAVPQCRWLTTLNKILFDVNGVPQLTCISGFSKDACLDGRHFFEMPGFLGGIQQESTFWRRDLWDEVGGLPAEDYPLAGDFALWTMFFERADPYGLTVPLGGPRTHSGQQHDVSRREYADQARRALEAMRERNQWSPRDAAMRQAYTGVRVKKFIRSPDVWEVERYQF